MTNKVEIVVSGKDQTGPGFGSAEKSASRFGNVLGKVGGMATRTSRGFGQIGGAAGKAGQGITGMLGGVSKVATGLGPIAGTVAGMTLGIGTAVVGVGAKVMGMAGSLELLEKKSKVVFGSEIGRVDAWAKANAKSFGMTTRETKGLAAGMADLLVPMGFTRKAAADMSMKTIGLSGALAEWSGGQVDAAGAADILQAAFLGERDGLQQLGISISQAEVDARLLKKGQEDLTGVQRQQAEATATQEMIFEKSADAQTAFANGAGGLSRKTKETTARLKEMGQNMLVTVTPALHAIAGGVNKHVMPQVERFANWIAGPGKYAVVVGFLEWGRGALGLVKVMAPAMRVITGIFLRTVQALVDGAAQAFGWVPDIGPKLRKAAQNFGQFKDSTLRNFDTAIAKVKDWDAAIARARTMVSLRGDISDLNTKLASARAQLNNPNLTRTRRAQIQANVADLEAKLRRAQAALDRLRNKTVTVRSRFITERIIRTQTQEGGGHAPGHAHGGYPRGFAWVGEHGPELAQFPAGTRIRSAGTSRQMSQNMATGPAAPLVLEIRSGGSRMDDLLVEVISKAVRNRGGDVQVVLGGRAT